MNKTIEEGINNIFIQNNEVFTDKCKFNYGYWPKGENGDKIKKEVQEYLQKFIDISKNNTISKVVEIGTMEINGTIASITINITIQEQLATINNKWYSLYSTSYENISNHICNPTLLSVSAKANDVKYTVEEVCEIEPSQFLPIWEIEQIIEAAEDHFNIHINGKNYSKQELEQKLKFNCDNPEIYYEDNHFTIEYILNGIKNKEISLKKDIERKEILKTLEYLIKWKNNDSKMMTKEQEDFFNNNKEKFKEFNLKIKDTLSGGYYGKIKAWIIEENKKFNNEKKIDMTIPPGWDLIKEINNEVKKNIIKKITNIKKSHCKKSTIKNKK